MSILETIEKCIKGIAPELLEGKMIFIELDRDSYELLEKELVDKYIIVTKKVEDIGKCTVLNYMGYIINVIVNKDRKKLDTFYFAFKTKIA